MALVYAGIPVELREVMLRDEPQAMLNVSPKGTVPVLVLQDGTVIDESRDVMDWALMHADPQQWYRPPAVGSIDTWVSANDGEFKTALDRYKYAQRHPEHPATFYRERGEEQLAALNVLLASHQWLHGAQPGFVDIALFPFVRQFAMVDEAWFRAGRYTALCRWLDAWLTHALFRHVMHKYTPWAPGQKRQILSPAA